MDSFTHEDNWRKDYENFLYLLLEKNWTIKLRHSEDTDINRKQNPFTSANININPKVIKKEKRICEIEYFIDEQKFNLEIYTPISLSPQVFIYRTYNKIFEQIRDNLNIDIWKRYDKVTNSRLKHFKF